MKSYYTAKEHKELLKEIVIVCTTNEQRNEHITQWFDEKKIQYVDQSLKTGDYCFKLPKNPEKGRFQDIHFTDELFIERKNSLAELASSIKNEAFRNELKRAQLIKHKYLIIEQPNGWTDILDKKYQNQYDPQAFYKTLHTFMIQYDLRIIFTSKEDIARQIYTICYSVLNTTIKK